MFILSGELILKRGTQPRRDGHKDFWGGRRRKRNHIIRKEKNRFDWKRRRLTRYATQHPIHFVWLFTQFLVYKSLHHSTCCRRLCENRDATQRKAYSNIYVAQWIRVLNEPLDHTPHTAYYISAMHAQVEQVQISHISTQTLDQPFAPKSSLDARSAHHPIWEKEISHTHVRNAKSWSSEWRSKTGRG